MNGSSGKAKINLKNVFIYSNSTKNLEKGLLRGKDKGREKKSEDKHVTFSCKKRILKTLERRVEIM